MALSKQYKQNIVALIAEECGKAETTAQSLLHAPEACCVIQALTVLSNCTSDISLRSKNKDEKIVYLRHPDSFKASLYQVINEMCEAFRTAHNSMDRIHLSLSNMPTLMTDIFEVMDCLDDPSTQDEIDLGLTTLGHVATTCVKEAQNAQNGCSSALNVIKEVLECAIATKGRSDERSAEAKIELEEHQQLETQKRVLIQELTQKYEEQQTIAREAMEDYKARMEQSTAFTGVVGVMLLDHLNTLINTIGQTAVNVSSVAGNVPIAAAVALKEYLKSNKISKADLMAQATENVLLDLMTEILEESETKIKANAAEHINNLECAISFAAVSVFGKPLQHSCKQLIKGLEAIKENDEEGTKKFEEAKGGARMNIKKYEKVHSTVPDGQSPEELVGSSSSEERITLMKTRLENLKISRETVAAERKLQEELRKEKMEADKELFDIMRSLERLKIEEIDLTEILKYLRQGIQQLTKVQLAWINIVTFFDNIKNTVDGPLVQHIKEMTSRVEIATKNSRVNERQKSILFREVTTACAVANVLMESAEFYKQISNKHIKPIIDDSLSKVGISQEEALSQQFAITSNFNSIRNAVQASIDTHNNFLSSKVYAAMRKQGFDISRAIEYKKEKERLEDYH